AFHDGPQCEVGDPVIAAHVAARYGDHVNDERIVLPFCIDLRRKLACLVEKLFRSHAGQRWYDACQRIFLEEVGEAGLVYRATAAIDLQQSLRHEDVQQRLRVLRVDSEVFGQNLPFEASLLGRELGDPCERQSRATAEGEWLQTEVGLIRDQCANL